MFSLKRSQKPELIIMRLWDESQSITPDMEERKALVAAFDLHFKAFQVKFTVL
jgi:hypothetical protein